MSIQAKAPPPGRFFQIRVSSLPIGSPLRFALYLWDGRSGVLLRKRGETLTSDEAEVLAKHRLLVAEDERGEYLASLKLGIADPDSPADQKSKFIKETAFLHMHGLFTRSEITPVIQDAKALVEEMVAFVSGDVSTVASLMNLSTHDYYTYNHSVNVGVYSISFAKLVFGNDKNILLAAGLGGLLHDIGKKRIDWNIINKPGPLTPGEWEEIKRHPKYGKEELLPLVNVPEPTRLVVYEHHETYDGRGYPHGLKGDEISQLARLVCIADVFDALTTDRSYQKAMPPADALSKMFRMQPGRFDPELFKSFNRHFDNKGPLELPDDFDACSPQAILKLLKR